MSGISGGTARMVIRMPLPASHRRGTLVGADARGWPGSAAGLGDRIRVLRPWFLRKRPKHCARLFIEGEDQQAPGKAGGFHLLQYVSKKTDGRDDARP
jgi:hypothetical protein